MSEQTGRITARLPDRGAFLITPRPPIITDREPRHLLTETGGLLGRDPYGNPRVLPIEAEPPSLTWRIGPDDAVTAIEPSPGAPGDTTQAATGWRWVTATNHADGLRAGSLASKSGTLSVRPDGSLGEAAPEQATTFALLTDHELTRLRALLDGTWHSLEAARVLQPGEITIAPGFTLPLGTSRIGLATLFAAASQGDDPSWLGLLHDDGTIDVLRRFRPLVVFAAFGAPALFATLAEAIDALRLSGRYHGEVAILTDRDEASLATLLPRTAPPYRVCAVTGADLLDYTAARFAIADHPSLAAFRPILYLDTDVICDRPIEDALVDVLLSGRLCLPAEHELMHDWDFYGASLFRADPTAWAQSRHGASNGVIGLADFDVARAAFPIARRALHAHAAAYGRGTLTYYDQAMGSYVWHKTVPIDLDILSARVVNLGGWRDEPPDDMAPRGFMHFSGGIGNAGPKLERMRRYRHRIAEAHRA